MAGFYISQCSAGIFDVNKLVDCPVLPGSSFDPTQFILKTEQWGHPTSRRPYRYPIGSTIVCRDPSKELEEIIGDVGSILNSDENSSTRDKIRDYLKFEGLKPLFCIHNAFDMACNYFSKPIVDHLADILSRNRTNRYPKMLIISNSHETARITCRDVFGLKKKSSTRMSVRLLGKVSQNQIDHEENDDEEKNFYVDIMIGSYDHVVAEFIEAINQKKLKKLVSSINYIIVEGVQAFSSDNEFPLQLQALFGFFRKYVPRVIFFANGCERATLRNSLIKAEEIIEDTFWILLEKKGYRKIYDSLNVDIVLDPQEFITELALSNGDHLEGNLDLSNYSTSLMVMNESMQKLYRTVFIIKELQKTRADSNAVKSSLRNEKILVVTKSIRDANFTAMMIKSIDSDIQVGVLTTNDCVAQVEVLNFNFRSDDCDVIVIDWRSINDIGRGIVDSVIFIDLPEQKFFQTIVEQELEKLISRNCVQLKVYFMFDEKTDLWAIGNFLKLFYKYDMPMPTRLMSVIDRYRDKLTEIEAEAKRKERIAEEEEEEDDDFDFLRDE